MAQLMPASPSAEQKSKTEDTVEFERHLQNNNNTYPIDPKLKNNPLAHLSRWDLLVKRESVELSADFEQKYEFQELLEERLGFKMFRVKSDRDSNFVVRVYETFGDLNQFDNVYKNFIFVRETELIEYDGIYYNKKTRRVYITQPQYSQPLSTQLSEGSLRFESEAAVKLLAADVLTQMWIQHRCGFVNGYIAPHNVLKREFNDKNEYIEDGWKLNRFDVHKYKSKGDYVGDVGWSAPEMVIDSHKNQYLYANDIWCFGLLILYAVNNGHQPLEITSKDKSEYGQNDNLIFVNGSNNKEEQQMEAMEQKFKSDLRCKMHSNWYYRKLLKSDHTIKNYLVQLYVDNKMSLDLFHLLHQGVLVFDPNKRWNCEQIYASKWFDSIQQVEKKKKVHKLRISVDGM
eukprot:100067_1